MILSIIQPCFIPWLGYFEQLAAADIFLYLDDVQYTKKDWRNTNLLKSPNGSKRVFVPVQKTNRDTLINEVLISYNENWQDSLINKITQWYKKAPYFKKVLEIVQTEISKNHIRLVDLNYDLNNALLKYMEITTPIYFSSDIPQKIDNKNMRIVELCMRFKEVDILYDGKKAEDFIDIELFKQNGIEVIFQDYQHPEYPQLWGDFSDHNSVLDLLMNCGKESKQVILNSPRPF